MKSDFVEYPHYPIACCFSHRCTVAHHCHGKRINLMAIKTLMAKGKTSWQKEKDSQQNFFDAERTFFILLSFAVRLFFLPWGYSFSVSIFLFAVRFLFLPWGFSFCPEVFHFALRFFFCSEVNYFAVTVGWATIPLKFCSQRFLIFFQHVGIREN